MNNLPLAICQMRVGDDKASNLATAEKMIGRAASDGARLVVLPEVFNSPYQSERFPDYAEPYPGLTSAFLANCSARYGIYLVGGSIIEKDEAGRLYNTSYIFNPQGELLGRHRKLHLFDVDIAGGIAFRESDTLSPGHQVTVINSGSLCFGVMICFDVRFPELARRCVLDGAQMLIIPAAFNTVTGPAHWEILMRTRAVDNQCYVMAASPARNPEASYQAWGHSMIIDPWGRIMAEADIDEEILAAEIDFARIKRVRTEMPLLAQRRPELY